MNEVHFKLDSITRITLWKREPTQYYWAEPVPEKRGFFGLIRLKKALPAGWSDRYDKRCELSEILYYKQYGFDEVKNEIYNKTIVSIRILEKSEIDHHFNSDEEAIEWIDDVIAQAKSKFVVIGR